MKLRNRATFAVPICLTVLGWVGVLGARPPANVEVPLAEQRLSTRGSKEVANDKLVAANTRLSFKLFSEILKQQPDKNIFISPTTIAIALAMTYNGAKAETQQAIAQTLELQGMSLEDVNQANSFLRETLSHPGPNVRLSLANSLWARKGEQFNPEFIQKNQNFYGARLTDLDFSDSQAFSIINDWVKQSTEGKIEKIVEGKDITPNTILFLINAIYFKGTWSREFDKTQTKELPFTLINGTQKPHPIMFQQDRYGYYTNELFQAVSLPYGQGRFSLYIFLPQKNSSLKAFYDNLNAENWDKWISQFKPQPVYIGLPRFRLDYGIELNNVLKSLGMAIAFDPDRANFANMTSRPAYISKVKHNTFFEVNEEGSEAAGAGSVQIVTRGVPTSVIVDHPFFCVIRDNQTKTILFMGSVVEPR